MTSECESSDICRRVIVNVAWMPVPNRVEAYVGPFSPPNELCSSVAVFSFDATSRLLLSRVLKRGVDLVGGHIETVNGRRETPEVAVHREAREETGAALTELVRIGGRRLVRQGPVPPDYPYPSPISYQIYFAARFTIAGPVEVPHECGDPVIITHAEALELAPIQDNLELYLAARQRLGIAD